MRISLIVLTYNQVEIVARAMAQNLTNGHAPIDELIWVDNGSSDGVREVMRAYEPDVCILNKVNLGVSKGWNRGYAVATGDYIITADSDMLMPDGWVEAFRIYLAAIPNTGVACIFHNDPNLAFTRVLHTNGLPYHPCIPWGRRIVSRELLVRKIGYLREDFGLYGYEDLEWGHRAVRVCREEGLLTYAIPNMRADHLGKAGQDPPEYRMFKEKEGRDPRKRALLAYCRLTNYPYVNPYA